MNQAKVDRVVKCLQVVAGIYALQSLYFAVVGFSALHTIASFSEFSYASLIGPTMTWLIWVAAVSISSVVVGRELKQGKGWAWVGALSLCLFTLPSFCLPASILGLLTLLDKEVREPYLASFEFKF